MMPLESSVSDATIRSVTLESSIAILEASFTLICDVYSTGVTYDYHQLMIVICLEYRPLNVNGKYLFVKLKLLRHFEIMKEGHLVETSKCNPIS